jgi:hypothetical protein
MEAVESGKERDGLGWDEWDEMEGPNWGKVAAGLGSGERLTYISRKPHDVPRHFQSFPGFSSVSGARKVAHRLVGCVVLIPLSTLPFPALKTFGPPTRNPRLFPSHLHLTKRPRRLHSPGKQPEHARRKTQISRQKKRIPRW